MTGSEAFEKRKPTTRAVVELYDDCDGGGTGLMAERKENDGRRDASRDVKNKLDEAGR